MALYGSPCACKEQAESTRKLRQVSRSKLLFSPRENHPGSSSRLAGERGHWLCPLPSQVSGWYWQHLQKESKGAAAYRSTQLLLRVLSPRRSPGSGSRSTGQEYIPEPEVSKQDVRICCCSQVSECGKGQNTYLLGLVPAPTLVIQTQLNDFFPVSQTEKLP